MRRAVTVNMMLLKVVSTVTKDEKLRHVEHEQIRVAHLGGYDREALRRRVEHARYLQAHRRSGQRRTLG